MYSDASPLSGSHGHIVRTTTVVPFELYHATFSLALCLIFLSCLISNTPARRNFVDVVGRWLSNKSLPSSRGPRNVAVVDHSPFQLFLEAKIGPLMRLYPSYFHLSWGYDRRVLKRSSRLLRLGIVDYSVDSVDSRGGKICGMIVWGLLVSTVHFSTSST